MEGDRLVLAGHSLLTLVLLALAIISLIERNRITFFIWLSLLILFILLPLIILKLAPKLKKRVLKLANAEKRLHKKRNVSAKRKQSLLSKLTLKLFVPKRKAATKSEPIKEKLPEKPSKEELGEPIKIEPLPEDKYVKERAATNTRVVKTDFDRIIEYVDEKKEASITDIAGHFKLPKEKIENWTRILSEHGLVEIFYPTFGEARVRKKENKPNA